MATQTALSHFAFHTLMCSSLVHLPWDSTRHHVSLAASFSLQFAPFPTREERSD